MRERDPPPPRRLLNWIVGAQQASYSGGGSTNCTMCPDNGVTQSPGSTSVDQCQSSCSRGLYSDTGQQPCIVCASGTYSQFRNQSSEAAAATGRYGATACTQCPYGTFMPYFRADACKWCPTGKSTAGQGAVDNTTQCAGRYSKRLCTTKPAWQVHHA